MNVEVTSRGPVDPEMVALAEETMAGLETAIARPLGQIRVVLRQEKENIPHPARAEGDLAVGGKAIRGHVEAENMTRAIHDLAERLQQQIRRHIDRLTTLKRKPAEAPEGKWDHDAWVPLLPSQSRLAPGERKVIRRKVFSLQPLKASEAAEVMSELDHGFYLFHDSETGADSVVYHRDDGKLAVIAPRDVPTLSDQQDPNGIVREPSRYSGALSLEDAVREMDELNHRFMYFSDAAADRGAVIYLRHDGNYGLIEPEA